MQIDLAGPAGRLEALWEEPEQPRFAAVVCHPHPRHGGTMHNHATYRIARAVRAHGGISLRFNFRGVGRSSGHYDRGAGEQDDVRTALAHLAKTRPDLPRWAAGFSFGSWMALEAGCGDPAVRGVLCCGLALSLREIAATTVATCAKPVAIVQAERDEYGAPADVERAIAQARGPRRLDVVKSATHLFTEDMGAFEKQAGAAIAWLLETGATA